MDMYVIPYIGDWNTRSFNPDSKIFTFLNDGTGHFILQDESFCIMGTNCNRNTRN